MHSSKQIAKDLFNAYKRGVDPAELADSLVNYMGASSQKAQLKHILFYLEEYAKRDAEERSFRIESASEIEPSAVSELSKAFEVKKEDVQTSVNPDLIAGFRIKYGDILYDATLTTRLGKLKEVLI